MISDSPSNTAIGSRGDLAYDEEEDVDVEIWNPSNVDGKNVCDT